MEVRGLVRRFGPKTVLDGVDLSVGEGEIVALMGSSGGGKTTLLRCIAGLIPPTEGTVAVDGIDVRRQPDEARRHMGMVFQSAALFDFLNVADNVLFGVRRLRGSNRPDEANVLAEVLSHVGLQGNEHLMPSELSGGMRKRVGIARALAMSPRILLYDEPTTGLDPITTYTIDRLIRSLCDDLGVTSLVVSHDVSSVLRVADRVVFLEQGKLTFDGRPGEFETSTNPAIRELIDLSRVTELSQIE